MGQGEAAAMLAMVLALIVMEVLERLVPAKRRWRQRWGEKGKLAGVYLLILVVFGIVVSVYETVLGAGLTGIRQDLGLALWPDRLPILIQVLMLYFASDFIYYWIHRAIHRWSLMWRISGHGFHHAFHNLHALNSGATHPLEVVFLALPMVLLAAIFGAGAEAVAGATVLLVVNAVLAHANLRMDTPVVNWLFTNSNQHRRHHSTVFEVSNTNYACNAIIWDRLFGTYSEGEVEQTGIGPRQPTFGEMFLLPWREPDDADTAATRARAAQRGGR